MTPQPKPTKRPPKPSKPIARSWIKRKRPRRLDKPGASEGQVFMAFVRTQPCVCVGMDYEVRHPSAGVCDVFHACNGPIEANHGGRKPGVAMKAPDETCFPLCRKAHRHWTDHAGMFKGWTKDKRRRFADDKYAETYSRYLSHGNRRAA